MLQILYNSYVNKSIFVSCQKQALACTHMHKHAPPVGTLPIGKAASLQSATVDFLVFNAHVRCFSQFFNGNAYFSPRIFTHTNFTQF